MRQHGLYLQVSSLEHQLGIKVSTSLVPLIPDQLIEVFPSLYQAAIKFHKAKRCLTTKTKAISLVLYTVQLSHRLIMAELNNG